jgi:hypothetical protein
MYTAWQDGFEYWLWNAAVATCIIALPEHCPARTEGNDKMFLRVGDLKDKIQSQELSDMEQEFIQ